jgi:hypothetical protein
VFDFYGSPDGDARAVSDRIAAAAGIEFTPRISADRGKYYLAVTGRGSEICVESNQARDEDGTFDKQPADARCRTLLLAWHRAPTWAAAEAELDTLCALLAAVDDVEFLRRKRGRRLATGTRGCRSAVPAGQRRPNLELGAVFRSVIHSARHVPPRERQMLARPGTRYG